MAENNLFQLAQVVTELPMHHHSQEQQHQPSSPLPSSRSNNESSHHPPLVARKNACIVCAVCFTCSGYYGVNCQCSETQPRRGKNLPEGGLDSRAKKLTPQDRDDYEFTMKWLDEFTHSIYRDRGQNIIGLNDLTEVSLCKAHSSTLYRAKKRHQRNLNQAPPSPADSNGTMMEVDLKQQHRSSSVDSYPLLPQPIIPSTVNSHYNSGYPPTITTVGGGQLAAKVRELSFQHQQQQYRIQHDPPESPDFSMMTASTSNKRKRTSTTDHKPSSSASTPLYTSSSSNVTPLLMNDLTHSSSHHIQHHSHHNHHPNQHHSASRQPTSSFSSQLPPLHLRTPSLSSLSSTLQHQLHVTPNTFNYTNNTAPPTTTNGTTRQGGSSMIPPPPPPPSYYKVIETVSLKSSPTGSTKDGKSNNEPIYYIRNLAITDTYTFRDLLSEIDFAGPPPPGKRVVISDVKRERIFPLGQAIRSVIRYPTDTHVEFYLGLSEKPSIDWSNYK